MLRKLPAESGFHGYAKQSRSALTNCDKPLDQSKKKLWRVQCSQRQHLQKNAAPDHRDVKIWGHDFNYVPNLWLEFKCEIPACQGETNLTPLFLFMLLLLGFCRPCTVQNTLGGVTSWRFKVEFHRNVFLQVSFIRQCSTLGIRHPCPTSCFHAVATQVDQCHYHSSG